MLCPICKIEQPDHNQFCHNCSLNFKKYYQHQKPIADIKPPPLPKNIADLKILIWAQPSSPSKTIMLGYCILFLFMLIWAIKLISPSIESNVSHSFLHTINLVFHEAGHVVFRPFGQFITSLGGGLAQLLMPAICCGVLLIKTRDPFGASVALWWLGESLLDIAPYINDARAGQLPLLGGGTGKTTPYGVHDWNYLLTEIKLINHDHFIAKICFFIGTLIMIIAMIWAGKLLLKMRQSR